MSKPENGFNVKARNNTELDMEFVYLDPSHGVNAEILYTGDTAPSAPITTIPGMTGGLKQRDLRRESTYRFMWQTGAVFLLAVVVTATIVIPNHTDIAATIKKNWEQGTTWTSLNTATIVFMATLFFGNVLSSWIFNRIIRKRVLPPDLST